MKSRFGLENSLPRMPALEAPGVDPRDSSCSVFHFLIHVRRTAGLNASSPIPQTEEAHLVDAVRQGCIEQPEIAAFKRVHTFGRRSEVFRG